MNDLSQRLQNLSEAQRHELAQLLAAQGFAAEASGGRAAALVAYVTLTEPVGPEALREHLRQRLPGYMIPAMTVPLDAFPRTPNGKVDVHRLPAPSMAPEATTATATPPRNATERGLAEVWGALLERPVTSVHDDFFALGGDSLMSIHLFARIEARFGKRLSVATLFEHPTIAGLAAVLEDEDWARRWTSLVPIQPQGYQAPLFCIHAGGGHVLFYNDLAQRFAPERPVYGLQPLGLDGLHAPLESVEAIAAHYIDELRTVQPQGPYHLVGQCASNGICLEMAHQLRAAGEAVGLVCILDSALPAPGTEGVVAELLAPAGEAHQRPGAQPAGPWATVGQFIQTKHRRLRKKLRRRQLHRQGTTQERAIDRVQQALIVANLAYLPKPYPGPITLLRSQDFSENPAKDYHLKEWDALARGGLTHHVLPVHHLTMAQPPEVEHLATQLKHCLAEVEGA